jgi:hypothetical protein
VVGHIFLNRARQQAESLDGHSLTVVVQKSARQQAESLDGHSLTVVVQKSARQQAESRLGR